MKNHFQNLARCCLLIILFFVGQQLFAQKTITGVITDGDQKEPLIGGTVTVKGKSGGTVTDVNGKYSVNAFDKDVLVFTYIGMEKQEIPVLDKTVINVTLHANSTLLSEVVAIGYGVAKKSDLTGSISVVSAKDLNRNPSASAAQALQGQAPGVLVTQSGQPGGGATIRVRGVGSISKGADPIYILDGVQVSDINGIQPQDIENIQVLKDASATAIYGANGSNGVIILNTKRGKSGKPQVNLNAYVSAVMAPKEYKMMNADQYANFYDAFDKALWDASDPLTRKPFVSNLSLGQNFRQKYYGPGWQQGTDWQNEIFKTGLNQNYNLSIGGGGDNSNYNISLAYNKENGNVIKSNAERYGLRANSDFKFNKHIKVGENFSADYAITEVPDVVQSTIWDLNQSPLMKVYNPYYKGGFESPQTQYFIDNNGNAVVMGNGIIPVGNIDQTQYSNTIRNDKPNTIAAPSIGSNLSYALNTRASVYMQIDFTDWLSFKVTPSAEINYGRNKNWLTAFTGNRAVGGAHGGSAILSEAYSEWIKLNIENQLTFKKKFNNAHNVQATIVYQVRSEQLNNISATKQGFDFPQLNVLQGPGTESTIVGGLSSEYRMISYLGRLMYDYKGKYFLTGSYRSDGVSIFAPEFRRGNFGAASIAWKITEDFFKDVKNLDALKLRLGWGQTGNSSIGLGLGVLDNYQYQDQIWKSTEFSPVFGDDQHIANAQYVFYGLASKEIHWESAEMYNMGFDFSLFKTKLQGSAEYYIKNNNDLLVQLPISAAFGRQNGKPWVNAGKIQNRGVEVSLQWRDKVGDFNYGINTNFTTIKNEVLYLPVTDITTGNNRTIVGNSIGALYGLVSDGIIQLTDQYYTKGSDGNFQKDPVTGKYTGYKFATQSNIIPQPGDIKFKDLNGDGDVNALDKTIVGKTIPSFTYTLGFDCSYKSFDFSIFLFGVNNFDIFNQQRASLSSMNSQDMMHNKLSDFGLNHWTLDNASTTQVRVDPANANSNDQMSSFWIEDGSYLRIKDIQLGYSLPKKNSKSFGVSSIRVYANASNLYCFTAYKGRDPEGLMSNNPTSSGSDNGGYTIPQSFTFGLQIGF